MRICKYCVFLVALLSCHVFAQNTDYLTVVREDLDALFSTLDKSRVPTGLLRDYAVDLVDFELYDGINLHDTNAINYPTYEYMLRSIRSACVNTSYPFSPVDTISTALDSRITNNTIPVSFAAFHYNFIVQNALVDSLITYNDTGNRVYDVFLNDGSWVNPYGDSLIVGFSPRINATNSRFVSYLFDNSFSFTNLSISSIEFNPGDGGGFRTVSLNTPVAVSVEYGLFTDYILQLRINLSDGRTLLSKSWMSVIETIGFNPNQPNQAQGQPQNQDLEPDDYFFVESQVSMQGYTPGALVSVRYAPQRKATRTLLKPFIVVEGLDPFSYNRDYAHSKPFYRLLGANNVDSFLSYKPNVYSFNYNEQLNSQYDVVYIDWKDCTAPIQANADIVRQVIDWINTNKVDPDIPNIILGQSMGGLIAKYALSQMESNYQHHHVGTFISHDVPYWGANVPAGLFLGGQFLLGAALNGLTAIIASGYINIPLSEAYRLEDELWELSRGFSVRQMVYYYINNNMTYDPTQYLYFQTIQSIMGFPKGDGTSDFANIAASNGGPNTEFVSASPYCQIEAHAGVEAIANMIYGFAQLFDNSFWDGMAKLVFPQSKNYTFHATMSPFVSNNSSVFSYSLYYVKKFLWIPFRIQPVDARNFLSPSEGYPLDKANGSCYTLDNLNYNGSIPATGIGNIDLTINSSRRIISFVPAVSSLYIGCGKRYPTNAEYQEDFSGSTNYFFDRTPFNSYFVNSSSSGHISYMTGMFSWIQEMDTLRISGPSTVVTGDTFSMTNPNLHPSWTSSDTSVATVSSYTGQVTVNSQGEFTLSCTGTGANYRPYHFEKSIHTAVFDYALSSESPSGSMSSKPFVVRANSTTWDQLVGTPPNQLLHNNSGHRFYFSIHPAGSTAPITWSEESTPECFLVVQEGSASVVSFKAEYNGIYSDVISVVCHNPLEIPEFPIGGGGEIGPGGDDPIGPDPNPDPDPDPGELPDPDPDGVNSPRSSACTFYIEGEELSYSSMPSPQELLEDIKKIPSFWEKIGTVKPRGEKDFLIIPYQYLDKESGKKYDRTLKFIYRGK